MREPVAATGLRFLLSSGQISLLLTRIPQRVKIVIHGTLLPDSFSECDGLLYGLRPIILKELCSCVGLRTIITWRIRPWNITKALLFCMSGKRMDVPVMIIFTDGWSGILFLKTKLE